MRLTLIVVLALALLACAAAWAGSHFRAVYVTTGSRGEIVAALDRGGAYWWPSDGGGGWRVNAAPPPRFRWEEEWGENVRRWVPYRRVTSTATLLPLHVVPLWVPTAAVALALLACRPWRGWRRGAARGFAVVERPTDPPSPRVA